MLRPFNPDDLDRNKKFYEQISDIITRPISSAIKPSITTQKTPSPTEQYNKPFLSELTNISDELKDFAEDIADTVKDTVTQDELEKQKETDAIGKSLNTKNEKESNLLAMIFKIVPIGINIAKRGKIIATGFKRLSNGLMELAKNTALLTAVTGMDTIMFFMTLFAYLFQLLVCSVTLIIRFPKCFIYYLLELLVYIAIVIILSPLFIIDNIFMVKYFIGISFVESFFMFLKVLEQFDQFIYSTFSFHIIHYPDSVIEKCYSCMTSNTGYNRASRRLFNDIFVDIPRGIIKPLGMTFTGIGNIFSFLKI